MLNDSGADMLIVDDAFQAMLPAVSGTLTTVKHIVFAGEGRTPAGTVNYEESLAKAHGFQIVASKEVIDNVAWTGSEAQTIEVDVRGVVSKMQVVGIARGRDLPISILTQSPEAYTDA